MSIIILTPPPKSTGSNSDSTAPGATPGATKTPAPSADPVAKQFDGDTALSDAIVYLVQLQVAQTGKG